MRKVINGKLYDTDTATLVHEDEGNLLPTDFDYTSERLYRKRTGEYFVHGRGGAASRWAREVGYDRYGAGEGIEPLTYEGAQRWMEEHASSEDYEREFGAPTEGAEHDMHVIVSEAAWQAISRTASSEGTTIRSIIERLAATL
jgi:hypothetical protein